jgi:hypothetical protein
VKLLRYGWEGKKAELGHGANVLYAYRDSKWQAVYGDGAELGKQV